MAADRVYIEEWRFGDEGWVFDLGGFVRLSCEEFDPATVAWLRHLWEEPVWAGARQAALGDGTFEAQPDVLSGVIVSMAALECRYESRMGGRPIPGSGVAYSVDRAEGWTGEVDSSQGLVTGFVLEIESATQEQAGNDQSVRRRWSGLGDQVDGS